MKTKGVKYMDTIAGKLGILHKKHFYFTRREYHEYREIAKNPEENKEALEKNRIHIEVQRRIKKYGLVGIAVLDIETYIDNDYKDSDTFYNMVPFMLHLYGRLQQIYYDGENRVQKCRFVEVDQTFIGFHPNETMAKFVSYMIENQFIMTDYDYKVMKSNTTKVDQKLIQNYIFAHNGFGFDFRFLYNELYKAIPEFKLIGDINQTKTI